MTGVRPWGIIPPRLTKTRFVVKSAVGAWRILYFSIRVGSACTREMGIAAQKAHQFVGSYVESSSLLE